MDGASKALFLAAISNGGRASLKQLSVDHRVLRSCMQHRGAQIPAVNEALKNVLPASIASAHNLETLFLKDVGMGSDQAASFAASLCTLDHLTQLHLSGAIRYNQDTQSLLAAEKGLAAAVATVSTLQNVALESVLPHVVLPVLQLQALTSLTLACHSSHSLSKFFTRLKSLQHLQRLHVPSLVMHSSQVKHLAAAVAELPELTYLGLHQNHFFDNAPMVTDLLQCGSTKLRHLDLSGQSDRQASDVGMAAVADLVRCKITLWHVSGCEGIVARSGMLPFSCVAC